MQTERLALTADREFGGKVFLFRLTEQGIDFVIRLRGNLGISNGRGVTQGFTDRPAGDQSSSDGLLDNVSVVVVPEANTFALALPALGMVEAVVLRRRKK